VSISDFRGMKNVFLFVADAKSSKYDLVSVGFGAEG
jgi:hypothetical protein